MFVKSIILISTVLTVCLASKEREEIFSRAVGPCIADQCQSKHVCYYGQCVPEGIAPPMPALSVEDSIGKCESGMCSNDAFCHQGNCYKLD